MRPLPALAALLVLTGVAGCTSPVATSVGTRSTPSPTVTATPTPEAPTEPEALAFSGSDVRTLAGGDAVLQTVDFADGAGAVVELITSTVGEPTVDEVGEECAGAHTLYRWENLSVSDFTGMHYFVVHFTGATTGTVALEATGGYSVGDDLSADLAGFAADDIARPGGGTVFVAFDAVSRVTHGDYTSPVGAVGYLEDGATLSSVITPGEWSAFLC
jgi:hypothetical protein